MKTVTPTELRRNIFKILDEVIQTGVPIEIKKGGQKLRITSVTPSQKLDNLISRPDTIVGKPEDLLNITWENEVNLDLP